MTTEQIAKARAHVHELNRKHLEYSDLAMKAGLAKNKREEQNQSRNSQAFMWQYIGASTALSMLGISLSDDAAPAPSYAQPGLLADEDGGPLFSMASN